ncbi:response regulator [Prosthecochloris sp. SCSIO W1101]|uniref:response regulator n=1 Tax=Prosthecochloris sp. SCSIO W1101 TaxID=2992242 RepID=UPI00223D486A|nr:response regulator [Prosthecochloris sp. SCSIO W1101]UZJ42698.1 response regulator [Prosthecochloris sp. SCSIO W1101]
MKILIMDDEPLILKLLENYLTMLNHQVVSVSNGKKGLELFLRDPEAFDLIITDFKMSGLDGISVVACLKEKGYDIPVVFISGYGMADKKEVTQDLKIVAVLDKPFDLSELNEVLSEVENPENE